MLKTVIVDQIIDAVSVSEIGVVVLCFTVQCDVMFWADHSTVKRLVISEEYRPLSTGLFLDVQHELKTRGVMVYLALCHCYSDH